MANRVFRLLSNGMGGIDWKGLPLVCGWLGVDDIEGLLIRLEVLKTYRPKKPD